MRRTWPRPWQESPRNRSSRCRSWASHTPRVGVASRSYGIPRARSPECHQESGFGNQSLGRREVRTKRSIDTRASEARATKLPKAERSARRKKLVRLAEQLPETKANLQP